MIPVSGGIFAPKPVVGRLWPSNTFSAEWRDERFVQQNVGLQSLISGFRIFERRDSREKPLQNVRTTGNSL